MAYIILDTETTGTEEEDRICQLCYGVLDEKDNSFELYDMLCKPPVDISYHAMAVHHITPDMLQDKQKCTDNEIYKKLNTYNTQDNTIVIHNCKFDLAMLAKEGFESNMQTIDTLRCVKHLYPDSPSKALQYLRYSLGLYKEEKNLTYDIQPHDALGDVVVLKLLLEFLLHENTKEELIKLTSTPILYKKFSFGKYKGDNLEEVYLNDPNYFEYLIKNNIDDPDLGYSLRYFMDKNKGNAVYKFNVGKYKGKSVEEIDDLGYLKWAYENMSNMSDGLKANIIKKLGI